MAEWACVSEKSPETFKLLSKKENTFPSHFREKKRKKLLLTELSFQLLFEKGIFKKKGREGGKGREGKGVGGSQRKYTVGLDLC